MASLTIGLLHFTYAILNIYKSTADDPIIINSASWRKEILQTRRIGFNENVQPNWSLGVRFKPQRPLRLTTTLAA
jgi:hypothetical protein